MRINRASCISLGRFVWKQVLDTLFPLSCLGCGRTKYWLCPTCLSRLPIRLEQDCPTCRHHITPHGAVCFSCRDTNPQSLDGLFVASYYHDSLLPHAIHTWKYRFIPGLAAPLGQFLATTLRESDLPLPDALIPVPLHPRRLRFRGFNQATLLATELTKRLTPGLDFPVTEALIRTRYTKPQMKTDSREERLRNLREAFVIVPGQETNIVNKHLWLVDDVATTGTTLEECAQVLKANGARSVWGIVLAR